MLYENFAFKHRCIKKFSWERSIINRLLNVVTDAITLFLSYNQTLALIINRFQEPTIRILPITTSYFALVHAYDQLQGKRVIGMAHTRK